MDFGLDSLRTLLEDFLSDSGGRRGREREQRRQQGEVDDGDTESAADAETQDGSDEPAETAEPSESESDSGGGGLFGRGGSSDEEDLDDLHYRIEELEDQLADKESELGSVRDSQQQVADQVEEMNDTVRQLLGVYDMLTDDVNPFTGDGEERNGFGVFGEDESVTDGGTETRQTAVDDRSRRGEESVSFDDLKGVIEDAAQRRDGDGERLAFETEIDGDDDTRVEVQATDSVDDSADADPIEDETDGADGDSDVTLEALADTYATDIIVLEWLTELVRTAGPAATLRAISYYAEIGWIGEDVKAHLEATLSGPDLDIHVDPGATPDELTAEDHADSYTYIMKLQKIHETKQEVEPDAETEA
ncbi:flagella accessory C family protein [Natrinema saccharevitans]|uniref:Flagella accessory C family protein n=1 Tax=Natrinema saccharevitans TaxID=301967 RepID=A0A1S8AT61_9EURY|nr:FlaD/FlaE family flagellar protein [Natrinema saccharevitans]OLZ39731.1 flagella accessory C family protein [Natrinema saccharevitans]